MPLRASHTFAVLSQPAVTIRVPSGLKLRRIDTTVCPLSVNRSRCAETINVAPLPTAQVLPCCC